MDDIRSAITNILRQHKQIGIDYSNAKDMTAICLAGEQVEATIRALQKQIPQKPIETEDNGFICPGCKGGFIYSPAVTDDPHQHCNYCNECGQKLDWTKAQPQKKIVIRVSYKGPNQGPKIMVIKEYWENGEVEFAEVLYRLD